MATAKILTLIFLLSINIVLSRAEIGDDTETTYLIGVDDDSYTSNILFSGFGSPIESEREKERFQLEFPKFNEVGEGGYAMYVNKFMGNLPPLSSVQKLINYLTVDALKSTTRLTVTPGDSTSKYAKTPKYIWTITVTRAAVNGPPSGEITEQFIDETTTSEPF